MRFEITPKQEFNPVTVSITCENLRELQELEIRLSLYARDLQQCRPESWEKLGGKASGLRGITYLREKLSCYLGKDSVVEYI